MPNNIDPSQVKWKFFSLGDSGKIVASDRLPEGKKPVALINSSTFPGKKSETPKVLKEKIKEALTHKDSVGLCFALPCEDVETMKDYYGEKNIVGVEPDYVTLRMHNDLRKGNPAFSPHQARFEGTMPAKEGAEQIASAIENGYDIWSYNSGGNSIVPKLELCEEYFAQNFDRLRTEEKLQRKVKFVGFSNGTAMAFNLRGLVDYALGYGLSYSFYRMKEFKEDDVGDAPLSNQVNCLLRSLRGEDVSVERKFGRVVSGSFEDLRTKCEEATLPITNVAVWLGQMVPVTVGKLPKFGADEKVILELEYSMQHPPKGYEAGVVLRRFLESGTINPANILYVALGDFIDHAEENVPRKHGLIPVYEKLSTKEQEAVATLAKQKNLGVKEYISQSNKRSKEQEQEVRSVAAEYGIPVVEGGERRVSHGKYSQLAPSCVAALQFNEADSSITQTCVLRAKAEVSRGLIVEPRKMITHSDSINNDAVVSSDLRNKIDEAKITPLTDSAASFVARDKEEVVIGTPIDLATIDYAQIAGKGVVVYLPMVKGGVSPSEQFNAFQLSQNYANAKFIVLMMRIPAEYGSDEKSMMEDRNSNYLKLIKDLTESQTNVPPVFISTNSVEAEYFPPFSHEINLEKMLTEKPRTSVEAATAGKYGQIKSRL